jgi:hypothetical protein
VDALAEDARRMRIDLVGTLAVGAAPAVQRALDRDRELPAISVSNPDAHVATGSELVTATHGPILPGNRPHGIFDPNAIASHANETSGTARTLSPDAVQIRPLPPPTAPVANAERTIAGLRAAFRRCYQSGLQSEPSMQGQLTVTARVAPNGSVESARVTSNNGLSDGVGACIARQVQGAQFEQPGSSGSTLQIPVAFVQQR